MSTKSRGHPSVERDKSPDIYRHRKEDSYDCKARENLERHESKNKERDSNVNRHALSTVISADDNQTRYQLLAGSKSVPSKQDVVKTVALKSRSEEHKSEPPPPVTRGKSDSGVDSKSKRRVLVKQPTQGKFELKGSNTAGSETKTVGHFEKTGKNNKIFEQQVVSGSSGKRRTLPLTPFSIFRRKDLADEAEDDTSGSHYGSMQNAELIIGDSDKGPKHCIGSSKIETNPGSNLLADKTSDNDLSKKQYLLRAKSCTQPVVSEFIPLQTLKSKQYPSHGTLSSKEYEKKYKERIRLKERSVSTDDSKYTEHRTLNPSAIKSDLSDGKKSVAFCTVHSPSSYGVVNTSTDHGNSLKPSERYIVSQQKHFLSPENCVPMLEKSKSLQRLANQSSTETSGLGETVTSGLSSQESIVSYYTGARSGNTEQVSAQQDQGIDLREDTRNLQHEGNSTFGTGIIDSDNIINHTNEPKKSNRCTYCVDSIGTSGVSISVLDTDASQSHKSHGAIGKASSGGSDISTKDMTSRHTMGQTDHLSVRVYKPPLDFRSNDVKKPDNLPMFSSNVGPDFDTLFTQSKNLKVPPAAVGIQIDQINREWNKHNRSSSIKSRSSQGSFRSRSGSTRRSRRFLGERESQWMKWGRERRLSFRRRMEKLEKPPEPEVPRASTPVKKARQEGLMFIHPDLGSKYISEDDINYIKRHKQERLKTCKLIEKSKTKLHHEAHDINRLTADELMTLSRFWEHRVFVRSRYVSILLSLVTIVIYVLSICSTQWVTYPSPGGKLT